MKQLNILIACEFSGAIRNEFRNLGHNAISCDLEDAIDSSPHHYKGSVLDILQKNPFNGESWDLMIAHPPCTYLAVSGAQWYYHPDDKDLPAESRRPHPKYPNRSKDREDAIEFFKTLYSADIPHIAVENPIGILSSVFRKPDQIIQPWMFGDPFQKSTCLWLKNLPKLVATDIVSKGEFIEMVDKKTGRIKRQPKWYADAFHKTSDPKERAKIRNTTFPGIAKAVAAQYSKFVLNSKHL